MIDAETKAPEVQPLRAVVFQRLSNEETAWPELDSFLRERDDALALSAWFGAERAGGLDLAGLRRLIDRDVAEIDAILSRSADALLHHPRFQALEGAWRGVRWLVDTLGSDGMTIVRLLDCRWSELVRDLDRALEFDQSTLFDLLYNQEFGMPGGVPFSVIVGVYEVQHRPGQGHPTDDVTALRQLSRVCAAAFAPMILGVAPAMFEVDRFGELDARQSLATVLSGPEHRRFQAFQQTQDARFIALAAPRVLVRTAYRGRAAGDCGFAYEERPRGGADDELWINAAFSVAQVCLRGFNDYRWLAAIRGTAPDELTGGVVTGLPISDFETDPHLSALRFSIEVNVSSVLERDMAEAGFISLRRCKDTPYVALYSLPTAHRPKGAYHSEIAKVNEQLGSMLNYILCVSRFAHYLKVIGREWIGSFKSAEDCEMRLQSWLQGFCSAGDKLSLETKARYPLQDGRVRVRETPGQPGVYECSAHLKPHFQLDQAVSEFSLTTTVQGAVHAF